jgi:hypothetical protein
MLRNTSLIVCLALAALTAGCSNPLLSKIIESSGSSHCNERL